MSPWIQGGTGGMPHLQWDHVHGGPASRATVEEAGGRPATPAPATVATPAAASHRGGGGQRATAPAATDGVFLTCPSAAMSNVARRPESRTTVGFLNTGLLYVFDRQNGRPGSTLGVSRVFIFLVNATPQRGRRDAASKTRRPCVSPVDRTATSSASSPTPRSNPRAAASRWNTLNFPVPRGVVFLSGNERIFETPKRQLHTTSRPFPTSHVARPPGR